MTSPQKSKGHRAERDVLAWLRTFGYRVNRVQAGRPDDQGDIEGVDGVVIEVKDRKTHNWKEYFEQLERQIINKQAYTGVILCKRPGYPNAGDWLAVMPAHLWLDLYHLLVDARDK